METSSIDLCIAHFFVIRTTAISQSLVHKVPARACLVGPDSPEVITPGAGLFSFCPELQNGRTGRRMQVLSFRDNIQIYSVLD